MDQEITTHSQLTELNRRAWDRWETAPMEALAMAERATLAGRRLGVPEELAKALRTVGACKLGLGELEVARRVLEESEAVLDDVLYEQATRTETCRLLARTCFLKQEFEPALRYAHSALEVAQKLGDSELRAAASNDLGMIYAHLGSYQEGLEYMLASLQLLEEANLPAAGKPLNNIGNVYMHQGDWDRALDFFQRARSNFDQNGTLRDRIIALGNVGRAWEAQGKLGSAREAYQESLALARERNDRIYLPPALTKLGNVLHRLGESEAAFECLNEALSLCEEGSATFRDEILLALADLHMSLGEQHKAQPLYRETLELAIATENGPLQATSHLRLSKAFEAAGEFELALGHHQRYHELDSSHMRHLFSGQAQGLLLLNEVKQSKHEGQLLRDKNEELSTAYAELSELHQALEQQAAELEQLSIEDPLTKLFNRRHLDRRLNEEIARLERYGDALSLIMCDIDDFKRINDQYSHVVGDEILVMFAGILTRHTRDTDVVTRPGGEEFVLLLPNTTVADAATVAEKIRAATESHVWRGLRDDIRLTISAGVIGVGSESTPSEALAAADRELYRAKRVGKNRVCAAGLPKGDDATR